MNDFRICKACRMVKPITEFYVSNAATCKPCVRKRVSENRAENIDYYRQYDRERGCRMRPGYAAEYRSKFPSRRAAHIALGNAIRGGRITRLPCFVCGADAEAHHPDYSRPLDVVWLCPVHHKAVHREVATPHFGDMKSDLPWTEAA